MREGIFMPVVCQNWQKRRELAQLAAEKEAQLLLRPESASGVNQIVLLLSIDGGRVVRAGRVAAAHAAHVSSAPHVAVDACWANVTVVKADADISPRFTALQ